MNNNDFTTEEIEAIYTSLVGSPGGLNRAQLLSNLKGSEKRRLRHFNRIDAFKVANSERAKELLRVP